VIGGSKRDAGTRFEFPLQRGRDSSARSVLNGRLGKAARMLPEEYLSFDAKVYHISKVYVNHHHLVNEGTQSSTSVLERRPSSNSARHGQVQHFFIPAGSR
jgi:hypothetical protein